MTFPSFRDAAERRAGNSYSLSVIIDSAFAAFSRAPE
jgi:hypothetical protein